MDSPENVRLVMRNLDNEWQRLSPEELAPRVEALHGFRIVFAEMPLPSRYFGACMVVANLEEIPTGYVFYTPGLTPAHQAHVKIHELAHLALGHQTIVATDADMVELQKNPAAVFEKGLTIACRASSPRQVPPEYRKQEQEAELLTRLLFEKHFATRQRTYLQRGSSQVALEEALYRMGIVE